MIETEEQRRWWFATHPEYSSSRKGKRKQEHREEEGKPPKVAPEDVDAFVDESLKYADETAAIVLEEFKKEFGTQAQGKDSRQQGSSLPGTSQDAYDQYEDVLDGIHAYEQELDDQMRRADALISDPHTFLDIAPIGRLLTSPVSALKSLMRSMARGSVVHAVKRTGNRPLPKAPRRKAPAKAGGSGNEEVIAGKHTPHQNATIGEWHGYHELLKKGHIPIKPPGKPTAPGPDYITYNPRSGQIVIGEAKYRGPKGGWTPTSLPPGKLEAWRKSKIREAISKMPPGPYKADIVKAFKTNKLDVVFYRHPPKKISH